MKLRQARRKCSIGLVGYFQIKQLRQIMAQSKKPQWWGLEPFELELRANQRTRLESIRKKSRSETCPGSFKTQKGKKSKKGNLFKAFDSTFKAWLMANSCHFYALLPPINIEKKDRHRRDKKHCHGNIFAYTHTSHRNTYLYTHALPRHENFYPATHVAPQELHKISKIPTKLSESKQPLQASSIQRKHSTGNRPSISNSFHM